MIPGSNLLEIALTVIGSQAIVYFRVLGRSLNNVGQDVTEYAPAQVLYGSFQPVSRQLYEVYGLDLQKTYYTFYTTSNITDVGRDVSGDQIAFGEQRFQCESDNDWFAIDGWKGVLCVLIDSAPFNQPMFGFNETPQINNYLNFNNGNFKTEEN